jgi:hypothetical protein
MVTRRSGPAGCALLAIATGLLGCKGPDIIGGTDQADGGGREDRPPFFVVEAGTPMAVPRLDARCGGEVVEAKPAPLDLLLLVDSSASMNYPPGLPNTRWSLLRDALGAFIVDPRSTGLGIGLQFFPVLTAGKSCRSDGDCGTATRPVACQRRYGCADEPRADCTPQASPCATGVACRPLGRCSLDGKDCVVGQPCGPGTGTCTEVPGICASSQESCAVADYQAPAVPISALPAGVATLGAALQRRRPQGGSPLEAAVSGALDHLAGWVREHPDRQTALVIATDGAPEGCPSNDPEAIAVRLRAARDARPAISTYVIGVLESSKRSASQGLFDELAAAGGTSPFLVRPSEQLAERFLETLQKIRGAALACEFDIPAPTMGTLDFGRVNVSYSSGGAAEEILQAPSATRCDPTSGGWYYDADPDAGATPRRVIACPATCRRFQMNPAGRVELRFGCQTNVIP